MYILSKTQELSFQPFFEILIGEAKKATCTRSKCGSIILKDGEIIGKWYNSPPNLLDSQRRCGCEKSMYHKKVTDKTCCIHAEQRAIFDALKKNGEKILWSRLYFIRLDEYNTPKRSGKPYCTICSKSALDVGIQEFVLWEEKGFCVYDTQEYNDLSFRYDDE